VLPREESLVAIDAAMNRIAERLRKGIPGTHITRGLLKPEKVLTRLLARLQDAQIKIEVTPVLRGCVYEPELRPSPQPLRKHLDSPKCALFLSPTSMPESWSLVPRHDASRQPLLFLA